MFVEDIAEMARGNNGVRKAGARSTAQERSLFSPGSGKVTTFVTVG